MRESLARTKFAIELPLPLLFCDSFVGGGLSFGGSPRRFWGADWHPTVLNRPLSLSPPFYFQRREQRRTDESTNGKYITFSNRSTFDSQLGPFVSSCSYLQMELFYTKTTFRFITFFLCFFSFYFFSLFNCTFGRKKFRYINRYGEYQGIYLRRLGM